MSAPERSLDAIVEDLYGTLRELADRALARRGAADGLDPTDLVHEAYVKLSRTISLKELDRNGFVGLAATVIRNLIVDAARRWKAAKRGGDGHRITLDERHAVDAGIDVDVLDLDAALAKLGALDERQARIVELRFFGGLSNGEIGGLLGLTAREVSDEWLVARAFLRRELARRGEGEGTDRPEA